MRVTALAVSILALLSGCLAQEHSPAWCKHVHDECVVIVGLEIYAYYPGPAEPQRLEDAMTRAGFVSAGQHVWTLNGSEAWAASWDEPQDLPPSLKLTYNDAEARAIPVEERAAQSHRLWENVRDDAEALLIAFEVGMGWARRSVEWEATVLTAD